jgi:hypothetical protein
VATQGCAVACLAVGEVAGEADGGLGHDSALLDCLAGRSALPLDPGGRWMPCMLKDRQGQAVEPTKSARSGSGCRPLVGSGAGLVGRSACGWWSGMPGPSGQIPPPWMRWESEAFTARATWRPVQASPPGRVRPSGLWPADRQLRCGATCKPPAGPSLSALPGGRARLYGGAPRGGEHRVGRISGVQACSERGSFST